MIIVFILGYAGVIFEESLAFNKSGVGLLMAVTLWVIRSTGVFLPLYVCVCVCVLYISIATNTQSLSNITLRVGHSLN